MTTPALVGTVLDGKFQIERALASGAAGDVYEAVHLGLGSKVAVKVLKPGRPETAGVRRKRFVREARVAARIQSDHVVRVFDIVAPEKGLTYIVMELLEGETLAQRIERVGPMPAPDAVDYIVQAARPLAQLHDAGIIHRDVKPSNVFLARDKDGNERLKLLDFGVAAFQQPVHHESSITFTDAIVGTPRYMAPEQVRASKEVDARADVWALGVTLYQLLAGKPPFDGQTVLAVLSQIEQQEPPPLAARRPDILPELASIVHRSLAKDPSRRPADARALADALAPFATEPRRLSDPPRRPSDPLDLSLSDDDVQVIRPAGDVWRSRLAAVPLRTRVIAAGVACALVAVLFFAARGTKTESPTPLGDVHVATALAPTEAPTPPPAPAIAFAPPSTALQPVATVTTDVVRDAQVSIERPPSPRRAAAPAPARRGAKPPPRAAPTKAAASRPAEDDDRIE